MVNDKIQGWHHMDEKTIIREWREIVNRERAQIKNFIEWNTSVNCRMANPMLSSMLMTRIEIAYLWGSEISKVSFLVLERNAGFNGWERRLRVDIFGRREMLV
jgi:hypothetical protein